MFSFSLREHLPKQNEFWDLIIWRMGEGGEHISKLNEIWAIIFSKIHKKKSINTMSDYLWMTLPSLFLLQETIFKNYVDLLLFLRSFPSD